MVLLIISIERGFKMNDLKELLEKSLKNELSQLRLSQEEKTKLTKLISDFVESKVKLKRELILLNDKISSNEKISTIDEKILVNVSQVEIPLERKETIVPGIKTEKIVSEGASGLIRSIEVSLEDEVLASEFNVVKEPKLEVVLIPETTKELSVEESLIVQMMAVGQPVVLQATPDYAPLPKSLEVKADNPDSNPDNNKPSETVKVGLHYSSTFKDKNNSGSETKTEEVDLTKVEDFKLDSNSIEIETEQKDGEKSEKKEEKSKSVEQKPLPIEILKEQGNKVRIGLPAFESKELFDIQGEIFLDFYKAHPKNTATKVITIKPGAKTASVVPLSNEGKVLFLVEDENKPRIIESKEIKRIQEMTRLVSGKTKEEPRIQSVPKGKKQQSSKEVTSLVNKLISQLKELKIKRIIIEGPNSLASGSDKKDTFNDFIIRRIVKEIKNQDLEIEILLANNNKLNFANRVDFEDSLYPNLFYFSRQNARFKSDPENHLKNLIRLFDPSYKQK